MELKDYLAQNGWSATYFAKLIGIHPQTVLNMLNGIKPRHDTAVKIRRITGNKVKLEIYSRRKKKDNYEKSVDSSNAIANDAVSGK